MKILVTFQSKTGFTKKYAKWIADAVDGDVKDLSEVLNQEINKYDLIIHGGWIMGGMINGLDKIKNQNPKKLIVFGVGFTPKQEVEIEKYIEINKLDNIPFFYYEGGMDPKKMGFINRTIVKIVTKKKLIYKDNTNINEINELINLVSNLKKC